MTQTLPETEDKAALSSWSSTRPQMEDTNPLVQAFTRFNVYLYSKPPNKYVKKVNKSFLHLHLFLYRKSRGKIMGHFGRLDAMLLTTTGRKTRLPRTLPVGYVYDNGRYIVCAAPGHFDVPGGPQASHPAWFHNVRATPQVSVDIGPEQFPATARILTGDERDRRWQEFTEVFPFIAEFQKRASRPIPVLEITPDDLDPQRL
ncbi:nitroreductase family deazaflavin-dependent oxidoreductase [Streptomyces sp. NBC_00827]|uniref:nitroreductase family deazaflavin-dependent oxidoreductase n=1 Tax=Streptomyces sp. NBC_00827 TaxID=2903677 RepID=UPI00386572F7|nr:nitroreductase family deazaflavin-dependent oxidoreductase [Streptomyces sp. NBC_00827]